MMLKRNIAIAIALSGMLLGSSIGLASAQSTAQPPAVQAPAVTTPGTMPAGVKAEEPTNTGVPAGSSTGAPALAGPAAPAAVPGTMPPGVKAEEPTKTGVPEAAPAAPAAQMQSLPGTAGVPGPQPTIIASDLQDNLDKALGDGKTAPTPEQLDAAFMTVWEKVKVNYHSPGKLREWNRFVDKYKGKMKTPAELETALADMLDSLKDGTTKLTPASEIAPAAASDAAVLGFSVAKQKDGTYAVDYIERTAPVSASPLRNGDPVKSIGGTELAGKSPAEVQKLLQGKAGEETEVVVADGKVTLKLPFAPAEPAAISGGNLPNGILVVEVPKLTAESVAEFKKGLFGAYAKSKGNIKGIILDLRGASGSDVALAQEVASIFLAKGAVVIEAERTDRNVNKRETMVMPPLQFTVAKEAQDATKAFYMVPLAVLVDGNTAGAAQILAGALKNERAVVIGTPTYGNGVGVTQGILRGTGAIVQIGTRDYVTPQGEDLSEKGLTPDKLVPHGRLSQADEPKMVAVEALNEQISQPTMKQRMGGLADDAQTLQAILESLAVAMMLLGALLFYVFSYQRQKRELEKENKNKTGRGN